MSVDLIFRIIGMLVAAVAGWRVGLYVANSGFHLAGVSLSSPLVDVLALSVAGAGLALWLTPYVTIKPYRYIRVQISQLAVEDLVAGAAGLTAGLLVSALLALPMSLLPSPFGKILPFTVSIIFGYLGIAIMVLRKKDLAKFLGDITLFRRAPKPEPLPGPDLEPLKPQQLVLDTSVIIDGRIADISQTGFIHGTLLIPQFVLNELQLIADSAEPLKRNRGRRGLDILKKLQRESLIPIEITDLDIDDEQKVDNKLVKLALQLHCPIITNDFNLNRVAEIQGVQVLNIHELANAVKPVVLPSEEMEVKIIQEGREQNQGVAYLDDGTMIVVDNARKHINQTITVVVTRVLQTAQGRLIFAHHKALNGNNSRT